MARPPSIFWFRRDLRLADQPALGEAVRAGDGSVVPVFVLDPSLVGYVGPARAAYLRGTLEELDRALGGRLTLRVGSPSAVLADVAREVGARSVVATADFAPAGRRRDTEVARALAAEGVVTNYCDSPYVVAPGTVVTKSGTPARVFSAFRRAWESQATPGPLSAPEGVDWRGLAGASFDLVTATSGARRPEYFGDVSTQVPALDGRVGEFAARTALEDFASRVDRYDEWRNLPARDATSRLSAHLHFGTLHPRQVLAETDGASRGAEVFRSEIAWREFYADVLWHRPDSAWKAWQPTFEGLRVDTDARAVERFQSWARGETGYPLVDAAMRQLSSEGWMHNRARMLTASFLVKHLHLDWRWGARWFLWCLIDGDVASNQHGWQWTAGTGTDAAPFHRVFNPTLQAERFDPDGAYVHRYVRELRGVPAPACLRPVAAGALPGLDRYPSPMVDLARERDEALARYDEVRRR